MFIVYFNFQSKSLKKSQKTPCEEAWFYVDMLILYILISAGAFNEQNSKANRLTSCEYFVLKRKQKLNIFYSYQNIINFKLTRDLISIDTNWVPFYKQAFIQYYV